MKNYQFRLVDVFIRGLLRLCLEGSIHVKPNDMDVFSGCLASGAHPLMRKVCAAAVEQSDMTSASCRWGQVTLCRVCRCWSSTARSPPAVATRAGHKPGDVIAAWIQQCENSMIVNVLKQGLMMVWL